MGSLCSKSGIHADSEKVVGPVSDAANTVPLVDARKAAAEAAERRRKATQQRGTSASNINRGKLAAKVAANSARRMPEAREEERLVWD